GLRYDQLLDGLDTYDGRDRCDLNAPPRVAEVLLHGANIEPIGDLLGIPDGSCYFPSARFYDNHKFMAKSITDNHKKARPGRPKTTGTTPMTGVRLSTDLETAIINWAKLQADR